MINKKDKNQARLIRHKRVRTKVSGTTARPRLNVYRSLNEIYAQIIDDTKGATIVSASTKDKDLLKKMLRVGSDIGKIITTCATMPKAYNKSRVIEWAKKYDAIFK